MSEKKLTGEELSMVIDSAVESARSLAWQQSMENANGDFLRVFLELLPQILAAIMLILKTINTPTE